MPTLPLYQSNPIADAWHNVCAPGGYEWWYFDAEDTVNDRQIVAIFLEGFVFHPDYLRKHFAYRRNPAKHTPVLPSDYPCMYFVVYERGTIRAQFMTQYAAEEFSASRDRTDVRIGPNTLIHLSSSRMRNGSEVLLPLPPGEGGGEGTSPLRGLIQSGNPLSPTLSRMARGPEVVADSRGDNGLEGLSLQLSGTPWRLTARGPKLLSDQTLSANLNFRAVHSHKPDERIFLSREMSGAEHHWVIANPLCVVTGSIRLNDEVIPFTGKGYHDHNYGTGPLGQGLARWIWGRVLFNDQVFTFHHAIPKNASLPPETHLIEADHHGVREINVKHPHATWNRRTILNLVYPSSLDFDDVFQLDAPRVIDSSPFYLRLTYQETCRGREGVAFCEVAYPHRLRWPVLGRMIEMSIQKR